MLLHLPHVLSQSEVQTITDVLFNAPDKAWHNGGFSAGIQASQVKQNLQFSRLEESYPQLNQLMTQKLQQHSLFQSASLSHKILPVLINRYHNQGNYGNHVDACIQRNALTGEKVRTDLSVTLFLSNPDSYEGGVLTIEDTYGEHEVKLNAGDAILYPSSSLHRVTAVTHGERLAGCFWVQSLVKSPIHRKMLFDLDMAIISLRQKIGDCDELLTLTSHYHNLVREWAEM